jgi:hypothetical protein
VVSPWQQKPQRAQVKISAFAGWVMVLFQGKRKRRSASADRRFGAEGVDGSQA